MSYDKTYYETKNYENYSSREQRYHQLASEILQLLRQLKLITPESKVLDYGCAFGFLMKGLQLGGQLCVSGFDISPYASAVARSAGLRVLDAADGSYDIMLALDVFEHMTDSQLAELFKRVDATVLVGRIPVSVNGDDFHLEISRRDSTHVNCKTKEQWMSALRAWGYTTILCLNLYSIYDSDGVFCFLSVK